MLKITNFKVDANITTPLDVLLSKKLNCKVTNYKIIKKSLDARKKPIMNVYTIAFDVEKNQIERLLAKNYIEKYIEQNYQFNEDILDKNTHISIIGYGPAGMFSALNLVNHGYNNIHVYERGEAIEQRNETINNLFIDGVLNKESNIQFGEGGAGTYSDGKLTSRSKDIRSKFILETLVYFGAPSKIIYEQHPHVGSDKLQDITKAFSNFLIAEGVNINYNSTVTDFKIENNQVTSLIINSEEEIKTDKVILAIGHSSRDTIENLINKHNIDSEQKNFSVGFRIEHPQALINKQMYKNDLANKSLEAASYRVTAKTSVDKGVYSFCMCPGGLVVNSSSEDSMLCTNGMSNYKRNMKNANSAVMVSIDERDIEGDIFAGLSLQRELEKKAFILGGSDYKAPVQNASDYLSNKQSEELVTMPSFPNGYKLANLRELFTDLQNTALIEGLQHFDKIIPGFISQGVLTGVETRSSSPIRFSRCKEGNSTNISNLYPTGEGAGYAGGIVSSAIDGIKQTENIMSLEK